MFFWSKSRSDFDLPDSADQNLLRNSTQFFTVLLFSKKYYFREKWWKSGGNPINEILSLKKNVNKYAIF